MLGVRPLPGVVRDGPGRCEDGDGLAGSRLSVARCMLSGRVQLLDASLFGGCEDCSRTPRRLGVFKGSSLSSSSMESEAIMGRSVDAAPLPLLGDISTLLSLVIVPWVAARAEDAGDAEAWVRGELNLAPRNT